MDYSYFLHNGVASVIVESPEGEIFCPLCGHNDVSLWADDGEADLADWWQCEKFSGGCGKSGAVVGDDYSRTQNGLPVDPVRGAKS